MADPVTDAYGKIDWSKVNAPENDNDAARAAMTAAAASGQKPDEVAANLALSKDTGLPPDVVARNKAEIEKQKALDSLDFDHIVSEAPEAQKWMSDQHNAALIIDQPGMVGEIKRNLNDVPRSFDQGVDRNRLIDLRFKQIMGEQLTPDDQAKLTALSDSMEGKTFGTGGLASKALQTTVNFSPQMGMQFLRSGEGAVVGGAAGAAVGAGVGAIAGGVGAGPGAIAGFTPGAKLGWTAGSLFENFRQMSALTYDGIDRIKDDAGHKIDPDVARGASIMVGLASAPLDAYALGKLAAITPGVAQVQQFLTKQGIRQALQNGGMRAALGVIGQKFATGITMEGLAGAAQQGFQILGEEYAKQHSEGNFQPVTMAEAGQRVLEGATTNMLVAGTLGGANAPIDYFRARNRVFTPDEVAAHVENINNTVRESPLYQRSPDRFNDLVQHLAPDDRLYVNADKAAEVIGSLSPERQDVLFNNVPDLRTELETAAASGADVSIRKADYASFIAPHPEADALKDFIKLDPADTSVAERNAQAEFLAKNPKAAADIQNQVSQLPPQASVKEMIPAIERIVRKSMIDAGMTPEEAKSNAALYARTQARFAQPFGQSGVEAINKGLLEFQTVDEQGTPIKKGSNFSVLLNDLHQLKQNGKLAGADEHMVQAVKDFGARLDAAGLKPEEAQKLSSRELLDKIYPQQKQPQLDLGDMGTVTLSDMSLEQTPEGGVNVKINPARPVDPNGDILRQSYGKEPAKHVVNETLKDAPTTPYNGIDSPEFKEWFGDSKVVNEDGSPQVVYHGSNEPIKEFDSQKSAMGVFWFTSDKDKILRGESGAASTKEIIPVYLRIEKMAGWPEYDKYSTDELITLGYDGIKLDDNYVVFHPDQIKSIFNSGQFSKIDPNIFRQQERGFISFNPSKDFAERLRAVTVAFTETKNFSTGAHEFAHWAVAQHRLFADMARERIAQGDTTAEISRIADDWQALKDQVGAKDDRFTVDQEEQIARMFEAYMREGHAPSEQLRRIFTRFRDWLVKIYKDLKSLDVKMSDDVRGIFDRWLASDEEIQQVRDKNGALAEIAQKLGLSDDITARIADYVNSATSHAEEKLYRKLTAEQNKRETQAYKDELASMSEKVGEEFKQKREYNLINYLKENKLKLLEGPETKGIEQDILSAEGGENVIHPDDIADLYGYESGMDMLRSLASTKPFDQAVEREARSRLLTKFPDMIAEGRIHNEAVDAIVNDRVLLALDLMIKEIGRARGDNSRVGMKQFAMAMAQQQVEKMKMSESNYGFRYEVARDKEMKLALQASRAGDSNKAMIHLQRSMVNQIIYKQLEAFRDLRTKAEDLFSRVDSKDKDLAPTKDLDFVGAARFILYKYGLGGENFDINQWIADVQERNPDVVNDLVALSQMITAPAKEAKDLTVSEYRDIYNTIENIYATSRNMKELEIAGKRIKIDTAVGELIAKMGPATQPLHDSTQIVGTNRFRNGLSIAKAALRRVEAWTKAMDGGDTGPFNKYIWRPASEAEDSYKADREKWMTGYSDILKEHKELLTKRGRIDTQMMKSDTLGRQARLTFRDNMELIGFLLHTGNESNLDKLLGGYGIDRQTYHDEIARLESQDIITKDHWSLVQKLWDYVDSIKPMTQRSFKKMYGYRFEEIENAPVKTKYGTFRGGYWPAIADTEQTANNKSVQQRLDETRQYMLATTGKGFTKSRVEQYRQPLKTDLRLGSQHIDKVLRFVHLEPATREIARVLNRHDFKDLLKAHDYDALDGMLTPWLQRFSQQTMEPPVTAGDRSATAGRRVIDFMRSAAISQIIRYNPVVALQNIANMPVAAHLVGHGELLRSFAATTVSPVQKFKDMKAASKMMQERMSVNAIKVSQIINQIAERKGNFAKSRDFAIRHGMIFMHSIDSYLSSIVWHAAYNEHLSGGATDTDSIAHADSIVRQVMGASGSKDVAKMEASHPAVKAIMPFYSYFNTQANLIGTEFGKIMKQHGWAGSPKMFMTYISLIAAPAIIGDFVVQSLRGQLPNPDEDGNDPLNDWAAWATESQLKYLGAMVPFAGQGVNAILNIAHGRPADDRLSASPVVSALTTVAKTGGEIVKESGDGDVRDSRLIRDVMTSLGFVLNLPLGQVSKPISYAVDVNEGETQPDGPLEYMRGLVVGPPPKK